MKNYRAVMALGLIGSVTASVYCGQHGYSWLIAEVATIGWVGLVIGLNWLLERYGNAE